MQQTCTGLCTQTGNRTIQSRKEEVNDFFILLRTHYSKDQCSRTCSPANSRRRESDRRKSTFLNRSWLLLQCQLLETPQGVLGPEAQVGADVSVCSDGARLELEALSSFLFPERNSWTAVSICGRKVWFILGSTTWVIIRSTPDSNMPDLEDKTMHKPEWNQS